MGSWLRRSSYGYGHDSPLGMEGMMRLGVRGASPMPIQRSMGARNGAKVPRAAVERKIERRFDDDTATGARLSRHHLRSKEFNANLLTPLSYPFRSLFLSVSF